jgi:ppGpp synthetase/RelA/SpoT-type nucleotidyltranferase
MRVLTPTEEESTLIDPLVQHFQTDLGGKRLISTFLNSVMNYVKESRELQELIHSTRFRIKEPDHLADKLVRKIRKCRDEGTQFDITTDNLFTAINDLAGIRLLHLHTTQMEAIDRCLRAIIEEQPVELVEGPRARTWDNEYRDYFQSINIETQDSETMYTSVHYILASKSSTTITCEIQVRTLMEEVWGEVDHKVNYPHPNETVACREQIRALARATSSATRLVDSIFATVADADQRRG